MLTYVHNVLLPLHIFFSAPKTLSILSLSLSGRSGCLLWYEAIYAEIED